MIKRSWVEIDLEVLKNNYKIYAEKLGSRREVMAVVKANAYGHGAVKVATALAEVGCRNFAVSNVEEAMELRLAGIRGQILILGYTPIAALDYVLEYDLTQAIVSEEYAEKAAEYLGERSHKMKVHFVLDTGMNRIGISAKNPDYCDRFIRKYRERFRPTGMFTHLCVADTPAEDEFTRAQINALRAVDERIEDLEFPYVHCLNSAGGLFQRGFGDLGRLGIVLYGLKPDYENILPEGIRPAMQWKTVIAMLKTVPAGETIGYGRSYKTERDTVVATLPTGYGDGYHRRLSNLGHVIIHGKKAPIIGRVCMDQMMVDVTDIPEASFEDEVILLGDGYTADDMAHSLGTIGYEIVCHITKRVTRTYLGDKEIGDKEIGGKEIGGKEK